MTCSGPIFELHCRQRAEAPQGLLLWSQQQGPCPSVPRKGLQTPVKELPALYGAECALSEASSHPPLGLRCQLQPAALIKRPFQTVSRNNNKTPNRNNKTV